MGEGSLAWAQSTCNSEGEKIEEVAQLWLQPHVLGLLLMDTPAWSLQDQVNPQVTLAPVVVDREPLRRTCGWST